MTGVKDAGPPPALVETVAGLSAGFVATLVVHPLDIVKTRMQIHRSTVAAAAAQTSTPLTTVALLRGLARTPHPVAALYRGLTPNLLGNAASWASFFFFKSRLERHIQSLKAKPSAAAAEPAGAAARLTPTDYFLASGLAGVAVQVLTNPIWVLKTRMLSSDRGSEGAYPSMAAGARRVWREEGWRGFYRGLGISLLGVSHGAVQFAVYEPAKRFYFARRLEGREGRGSEGGDGGGRGGQRTSGSSSTSGGSSSAAPTTSPATGVMTNEATVVISTAAKLAAGAVTYPYQVVRSRLQNYDADARFGRGITGVARLLWREEGVRGFYRGVVPGVVRVLPATWVTFLVYENVKFFFPRWAAGG